MGGGKWKSAVSAECRILGLLVGRGDGAFGTKRLCQVCAEVTEMSGAGIMLMWADAPHGSLCTSNEMSDVIEQLQYALGEGPCVDAYRQDWPVLEPDLAFPGTPRWLAFAGPAIAAGVRAVFGFPLQVGAVRLGALNLCRDSAGPLRDDQHADALVMADIAAQAVLVLQAEAPPGKLGLRARHRCRLPLRRAPGLRHGRGSARGQPRPSSRPLKGARLRQRPSPHRRGQGRSGEEAALRRRERRKGPVP